MVQDYKYFQNILFTKIREVRTPERGTPHSAGIDFFMPEIDTQFAMDFMSKNQNSQAILTQGYIMIPPMERVLIPSGIRVWIENQETMLMAANKSGLSTKHGLIYTCEIVDSDYTGEMHIGLLNTSRETFKIYPGDKISQFIHVPILLSDMKEMSNEEYNTFIDKFINTERGNGGFGSTNKEKKEE